MFAGLADLGASLERRLRTATSTDAPGSPSENAQVLADITVLAQSLPVTLCTIRMRPDGHLQLPYAARDISAIFALGPGDLAADLSPFFKALENDDAIRLREAFVRSARDLEPFSLEFRVRHPRLGLQWVEGRGTPRREPDGGTLWHGFVSNITEKKSTEDELERLNRSRGVLLDLTRSMILGGHSEHELAHRIYEKLYPLLEIDIGFNYRVVDGELVLVAARGISDDLEAKAKRVRIGDAICGKVVADGEAIIMSQDAMVGDPRTSLVRAAGAKCYVCLPLLAQDGHVLGTLSFGSTTRPTFSAPQFDLLTLLANYLALAWERLAADRSAVDNRMRLQRALDVAELGIFDHDLKTGHFDASPRFREIARLPGEQPISLNNILEKMSRETRGEIKANINKARDPARDGLHRAEYPLETHEGHTRWLSVSSITQFEGSGTDRKPVRTIGAISDITERKTSEQKDLKLLAELAASEVEMRHQRMLFQAMFDSAPDAILVTDLTCHIQRINAAFSNIFQYEPDELINRPSMMIYAQLEEAKQVREIADNGDHSPIMSPHVISFQRKDKSTFKGVLTGAVLKSDSGEAVGYIGLIRDVTDDIKREQALQEARRLESIGRLTGGIAHDFNNLLTILSGNLQLMGQRRLEPAQAGFLRESQRAIARGARLTRQMMTFAKKRQLAPAPTDCNKLTISIIDLIRTSIGEMIEISTNLCTDLRLTLLDRLEMENALLNLVLNARDAMPSGGTLLLSTANVELTSPELIGGDEAAPGRYVRVSVQDTGTGMTPDVKARVFEPFFTTKEAGKGSGLGLAIVHGFVRQSGGFVAIESDPGKGTTVSIWLPALEAHEIAARPDRAPSPPHATNHEVVLVVEDNADVRRVTVKRLAALGYRPIEAADGPSALRILEQSEHIRIDLVFTDILMSGGMNGFELAREIKKRFPGQRLLFTSGGADISLIENEGANVTHEILRKPYSEIDLAQAIRAAIDEAC